MANESKLKNLLADKIAEAGKLVTLASKEGVEAEEVAKKYLQALTDINDYCKERSRY